MRLPRGSHLRFYFAAVLVLPFLLAADRPNPAKLDDPSLRLVHTKHYDIHTDMDEALVTDLSTRMDSMYDQYLKTFSDFKPRADAAPLPVYLFATHEKYMAFTDYSGVNTGGLFIPGRHPFLTAYEQGQGRDALRRTLQHEAFHQFAYQNISRQLPPWLNEGLAQLFEESIWEGDDFITGQVPPRRIRQLHVDTVQKHVVELDQFLFQSSRDWTSDVHTNLDKAASAYNQAWAIAYFCSSAGDPAYHKSFADLLKKLHEPNTDPGDAIRKAFPDLKDFRKKFNAFAASLKATPESTQLENQDILGDFLLAVTQHGRPVPADMAAFRHLVVDENLKIEYEHNKFTHTTSASPIVYFSDLAGVPYKPGELFFRADLDAPLPDIICQPAGSMIRYRTRFYVSGETTEHEMLIEALP
jgi:hypothetical protein